MKTLKIALVIALLLPLSVSAAVFERDLSYGMQQDNDVVKLQEFLTTQGVYGGPITGNFYSLTLEAVKQFQGKEGIGPAAGYFGPLTRSKANEKLGTDIEASNAQATQEGGLITKVSSTTEIQLASLLQQIALLQQQVTAMNATKQSVDVLGQKVDQQTQTLTQIQQNTVKLPYVAPPAPEPKKELILAGVDVKSNPSVGRIAEDIFVFYLEDGVKKGGVTVVATSDEERGVWFSEGISRTSTITQFIKDKSGYRDGQPVAFFQYIPMATGTRVLTFTTNGVSVTTRVQGQSEEWLQNPLHLTELP